MTDVAAVSDADDLDDSPWLRWTTEAHVDVALNAFEVEDSDALELVTIEEEVTRVPPWVEGRPVAHFTDPPSAPSESPLKRRALELRAVVSKALSVASLISDSTICGVVLVRGLLAGDLQAELTGPRLSVHHA